MPIAQATDEQVRKIEEERAEVDEPIRYISQKVGLSITLKMPRRIITDGRDVNIPGIRAKFENGEFTTRKKAVIDLMDGMLTGPNARRWNRIFQRTPSQREMRVMADVAKRVEEAKKKALEEALKNRNPDEVKKWKTFSDFNKSRLSNLPVESKETILQKDKIHTIGIGG